MHLRRSLILFAALGGAMAGPGCRALDGLGGFQFDLTSPDGGGGGTGGAEAGSDAGPRDAGGSDAGPRDAGRDGEGGGGTGGGGEGGGADADADAACAPTGYDCEVDPPPGWSGPIAIYEGAPGTVPSCPAEYPSVVAAGGSGLSAPSATCSACTCGAPAVTCSAAPLEIYQGSNCPSPPTQTLMLAGGACTPVSGMTYHCVQLAPQASVGTCTPAGGVPDLPPPVWATSGIACGSQATPLSCAGGTWCTPAPPAPFEARSCVWASGAQTCPAAFPQQHVWETDDDERSCTPCACGAPGPATCAVTTALYSDPACGSHVADITMVGTCVHESGIGSVQATTSPSGSPTCAAGGGQPTGSVVTTPAVTVCCPG
jgi:hypothetical protein